MPTHEIIIYIRELFQVIRISQSIRISTKEYSTAGRRWATIQEENEYKDMEREREREINMVRERERERCV